MHRPSTIKEIIAIIPILTALAFAPVLVPVSHAYGSTDQWQVAEAGTFTTTSGHDGFWGWCAFGGSSGSSAVGTTGSTADCQITVYIFGNTGGVTKGLGLLAQSISGTAWIIEPGLTGLNDFFITDGTMTLTGPTIAEIIASGVPPPPGCTASGKTATCPLSVWEALGIYQPDTGIPALAGHFSFTPPISPPGTEVEVQVTQIP